MQKRTTRKPENRWTMTIPEFAAVTGCSRNLAYSLARQDKLPVPVIRLGERRMVVSCRAVNKLLSPQRSDPTPGSSNDHHDGNDRDDGAIHK